MVKGPPITVAQFLGFTPPAGRRAELIDGEIIVSPDPTPLHQEVALNIFSALRSILSPVHYVVQMRTNFQAQASHFMPSPDVFVLETARWREARRENRYPLGSPFIAVEVISPSNHQENVQKKLRWYLQHGSKQVWIANPGERSVLVHEAARSWELSAEEGVEMHRLYLPESLSNLFVPISDFFRLV